MSIQLTTWLEDTFATQLLLGQHWLSERSRQRVAGVKLESEQAWKGLYHDSGSRLSITNDIPQEENSFLQIVQLDPPLLCDRDSKVQAHFSPECLASLRRHHSKWDDPSSRLFSVVSVRRYTIEYTSYGPPREKLRFILHSIDWLEETSAAVTLVNSGPVKPLWSEEIENTLRRLHDTRAREDYSCLRLNPRADAEQPVMAGINDNGGSQAFTQAAFGTQVTHSVCTLAPNDEPQYLGTKPMEPILAGFTKREEVLPKTVRSDHEKRTALLRLLKKVSTTESGSSITAPVVPVLHTASSGQHATMETHTAQPFTQLPAVINRQPTQLRDEDRPAAVPSPKPIRSTKEGVKGEHVQPKEAEEASVDSASDVQAEVGEGTSLQDLAGQCYWMKDFDFTREAFRVDYKQQSLLQRDESWHKPPPGKVFPEGNIPIGILQTIYRLTDENAASGAGPDSDDDMEEDPSPESVESINPSPELAIEATQTEEPPSTFASWSPTPEPPQLPTRVDHALPPDSSFERPATPANLIDENEHEQSRRSDRTIFSNNLHVEAPCSSPPVVSSTEVVDEEMEMESYIPQALGEDIVESPSKPKARSSTSSSPQEVPIVQVKETPYVKGRQAVANFTSTSAGPVNRTLSGSGKKTSSASIVCATYNDVECSGISLDLVGPSRHQRAKSGNEDVFFDRGQQPREEKAEITAKYVQSSSAATKSPVTQLPIHTLSPPQSPSLSDLKAVPVEATISASSRSPSMTSVSSKRKFDNSPSKKPSRQPKRREIKIVGLGDKTPCSTDPASSMRQHREESFRKFREMRKSSASSDGRSRNPATTAAQELVDPMVIDSLNWPSNNADPTAMSPRHKSLYEETSTNNQERLTTQPLTSSAMLVQLVNDATSMEPRHTSVEIRPGMTIFAGFKAAYPEYTGDAKHFAGQCSQMYALDLKDRMVPKWQWDDYIIRSRTDFRNYAVECLDRGEDAGDYIRFYKDHIRDTIYRKDIVTNRQTLECALQELKVSLSGRLTSQESTRKKSRSSLPSAFIHHSDTTRHYDDSKDRKRPRYSLPTGSHTTHSTPSKLQRPATHHTPTATTPTTHTETSNSRLEDRSDPFRDFFFAQQRLTSLTGSTKVDTSLPWPKNLAIRPSVDDVPKKKVNVLKWRDEL